MSQVIRLLIEGTASSRLKEGFRNSLFPGSWTTHVEGNRVIISHDGAVMLDEGDVTNETRKNN